MSAEILTKKIEYTCKNCKCIVIKERKCKASLTEKKCKNCGIVKDISNFHSNGKQKGGYMKKYKARCKECMKERASKLYYNKKNRLLRQKTEEKKE